MEYMSVAARLNVLAPVLETKSAKDLATLVMNLRARVGVHGNWGSFLAFEDPQYENVLNAPFMRAKRHMISFLLTLREPQDLQELASLLSPTSRLVYDFKQELLDETSEQRLVRTTLCHGDYSFEFLPLFVKSHWALTGNSRRGIGSLHPTTHDMIALSTDMVLCDGGEEVAVRVVAINRNFEVVLNTLVKPNQPVEDYMTDVTGLTSEDLQNANTLAYVQAQLKTLFQVDTIMVGHRLSTALKGLKLHHARVIDTSLVFNYTNLAHRPSLNDLCRSFLLNEPNTCLQKAQSAMSLVLQVVDNGADTSIPDPEMMEVGILEAGIDIAAAPLPGPPQRRPLLSILSFEANSRRIHFIHRCSCNDVSVHLCAYSNGHAFIRAPPNSRPSHVYTEWSNSTTKVRVVCVCEQVMYLYSMDSETGYGNVESLPYVL